MAAVAKRQTSLTPDAEGLEGARELGINVSAVAEARREQWLVENADAFAAQSNWHARNGHPLADIIAAPGRASWSR
ncbi:MAG: hypothetical protein CMH88_15050 [Oceanibulbus sp.]|jgi:antitoxin CcdA|nr:hypothetical protein [Sulfitobacter sp.]|tara:strand:+ start:3800 stop:4027 length:228 start_codon:yes stop_codon:yes gene_type:complete